MATKFFGVKDWTFQYSHSVGRNEYSGRGFRFPVDLAVVPDGAMYVVNRAYVVRPDGIHLTVVTIDEQFVGEFGSYGDADGQFVWPTAVVLDREEKVYVADEWLNRISIFNRDGEFLSKWGMPGSGPGELNGPAGLAMSEDGIIYLSDSRNHRVQKFTLDGQYLGHFGSWGTGTGHFNMPWGICLDKEGLVYVADWRNDRIQVFSGEGQWQASFGRSGQSVGEFNRPTGVAVDRDGLIYVADWLNNRVQILKGDGKFIAQLQGDNQLSEWAKDKLSSNPEMVRQRAIAKNWDPTFEKSFRHPCAVKVDDQNRIVVLDQNNSRVQVYVKRSAPVLA